MNNKQQDYTQLEYDIFIEEINKNIFNWELVEIIEATYAYKKIPWGFFYNKTLFQDYWNFKYSKSLDLWEVYFCVWKKLQNKILQIDYYIEKGIWVFSELKSNKIRLKFLKKQLLFTKNSVEIALYWLPFEIEKAGFQLDGDFQKIHLQKLASLEKKNFWWSIKAQPCEVIKCYEFLKEKQQTKFKEQAEEIEFFLKKIEYYLPKDYEYIYKKKKKPKGFSAVFSIKIHQDDYMKIFDSVFELYGLPQRTLISNVGSIYDGEKFLEIPNKKTYEYKSIKYILSLLLHEVMAHTINLENTKKYLWNFRWSHNLEKEEGLAILLEKLFQWEKLENIDIIWSLPALLVWEICTNKDYKIYLSIFYKDSNKAYLRFKRNYSQKHKWVQHKDSTYSRWALKVKDLLLKGESFQDLFLWKVSFAELEYLKRIKNIKKDIKDIKPLFIAEMLSFIIHNSYKHKRIISIQDFIKYMDKKYSFIDTSYFEEIYSQKKNQKKIHTILSIFQKYVPDLETSYDI
jgi:hypothetical protein